VQVGPFGQGGVLLCPRQAILVLLAGDAAGCCICSLHWARPPKLHACAAAPCRAPIEWQGAESSTMEQLSKGCQQSMQLQFDCEQLLVRPPLRP
jgi:hypothetical protein